MTYHSHHTEEITMGKAARNRAEKQKRREARKKKVAEQQQKSVGTSRPKSRKLLWQDSGKLEQTIQAFSDQQLEDMWNSEAIRTLTITVNDRGRVIDFPYGIMVAGIKISRKESSSTQEAIGNLTRRIHETIQEMSANKDFAVYKDIEQQIHTQILETLIEGVTGESQHVADDELPPEPSVEDTSLSSVYEGANIPSDWGNSFDSHMTLWQELEELSKWFRSNHLQVERVLRVRHNPDSFLDLYVSFHRRTAGAGAVADTAEERWVRLPAEKSKLLNWGLTENIIDANVLNWFHFPDDGVSTNLYDIPNYVLSLRERESRFNPQWEWKYRKELVRDELLAVAERLQSYEGQFTDITNRSSDILLRFEDTNGKEHRAVEPKFYNQALFQYLVNNPSRHKDLVDVLNVSAVGLDPSLSLQDQVERIDIPFPDGELQYERALEDSVMNIQRLI